jgi:hypothetical protein
MGHDAIQALALTALKGCERDRTHAMTTLLGLVTLVCRSEAAHSAISTSELLALVPLENVTHAMLQELPQTEDPQEMHQQLAGSHYCSTALCLLQQLAICVSVRGIAQSDEVFEPLLQLLAALTQHAQKASSVPQWPDGNAAPARAAARAPPLVFPLFKSRAEQPTAPAGSTADAAHSAAPGQQPRSTELPTLRQVSDAASASPPGYTSTGRRHMPAVLAIQVTRILTLLLSIPKPPAAVVTAVITSQIGRLQDRILAFCRLLTGEDATGVPVALQKEWIEQLGHRVATHACVRAAEALVLTMHMIEDLHASLELWAVLSMHRGLLILAVPAAVPMLRGLLCKLLQTIAHVPTDQAAVARLSSRPQDPLEATLAEEPTTKASEPLLGLYHYWFWVTSVCVTGASSGALPPCARSAASAAAHASRAAV